MTDFNPEATEQTLLAQFGIILLMMVIPAIAIYMGMILFIKAYDLKPEKVKEIRKQLKELNL